jgi:hypothetical protein
VAQVAPAAPVGAAAAPAPSAAPAATPTPTPSPAPAAAGGPGAVVEKGWLKVVVVAAAGIAALWYIAHR